MGDGTATWGTERELNALEAVMWRAQAADPRMRSTTCSVEILDRAPDRDRLLAAHEWASRYVPRVRHRVVEPAFGIGAPVWAVDPDFDLDRHLRFRTLPQPGTMRQLLDLAQELAAAPFDPEHPPWEAVVVEGLEGGRAAYLLKLHHSVTDGMGGVQLLSLLHSRKRAHTRDKPQPPAPDPEALNGLDLLLEQVAGGMRSAPGALARDGLGAARRLVRRPDRAVADALEYARSFRRVAGPPPVPGSPLLAARSLDWRFEAHALSFSDLRAAAKAAGASVNDAYIAALLGALRRYHEAFGVELDALPLAMPVSLRSTADAAKGGNAFAGVRLAGPVGEPDVRRRIERVGEASRAARHEPALNALGVIAPVLGRLPGPAIARLGGSLTAANDLQASNFAGIAHPVYLAGARITHVFPFGPLPGCAAMIALVSHNGTACVGANLDPAAFTDPELFARCLGEGFAEVLELVA